MAIQAKVWEHRWSRKAHALKTEVQEHAKLQQLKTDEEHSNPSNHTMQKY